MQRRRRKAFGLSNELRSTPTEQAARLQRRGSQSDPCERSCSAGRDVRSTSLRGSEWMLRVTACEARPDAAAYRGRSSIDVDVSFGFSSMLTRSLLPSSDRRTAAASCRLCFARILRDASVNARSLLKERSTLLTTKATTVALVVRRCLLVLEHDHQAKALFGICVKGSRGAEPQDGGCHGTYLDHGRLMAESSTARRTRETLAKVNHGWPVPT